MADLEELKDRVRVQLHRRDRASHDLARAEAGLSQARATLKQHGVSTVKEARLKAGELDAELAKLKREVDRDLARIEAVIDGASQS